MQPRQGVHQQKWMQWNVSLFKMLWMTKDDDPEAYIKAFEQMAMQTRLNHLQWACQLGALVVDKAQAAYWALSREEAHNYDSVKATILYWLEISPDSYRQAF